MGEVGLHVSLGIHIMGTLSLAVSHHVSIGGTCICKHDGDSVGSKDVESETNGHPHPGRAPALTCPLTGHVPNVWYVSGESKVNTPNWDPPISCLYRTHPSYGCLQRSGYANAWEGEPDLGLKVIGEASERT